MPRKNKSKEINMKFFIYIPLLLIHLNIFSLSTFKICSTVTSPYINGDMNTGEAKGGIDIEVMDYIFKKLNINYEIKLMPWSKCLFELKEGLYDSALQTSKDPEREKYLSFPENFVWESVFVFHTNKEVKKEYKIKNFDDAKKNKLIVGVTRNNSYYFDFWEAYPWINKEKEIYHPLLEVSYSHETNLAKLAENKIQLYPMDKTTGIYMAKKLGLKNITHYDFILFKKPYYLAFSKKSNFSSNNFKNIDEFIKNYDLELIKLKKTKKFIDIFKNNL